MHLEKCLNLFYLLYCMDKKDDSDQNQVKQLSICDVMKGNTSKTIQKLESGIPSFVQNYSDLYTAYLHMYDDLFGVCYLSEKEFFDKLNLSNETLLEMKKNFDMITENFHTSIDATKTFFDFYTKMRINTIHSFDNYVHVMIESYSKILSQFNNSMNRQK